MAGRAAVSAGALGACDPETSPQGLGATSALCPAEETVWGRALPRPQCTSTLESLAEGPPPRRTPLCSPNTPGGPCSGLGPGSVLTRMSEVRTGETSPRWPLGALWEVSSTGKDEGAGDALPARAQPRLPPRSSPCWPPSWASLCALPEHFSLGQGDPSSGSSQGRLSCLLPPNFGVLFLAWQAQSWGMGEVMAD